MLQSKTLFGDGNQSISRHRGPDLSFDGVGRGSKETPDAQVLLDPFEKQFDLPSVDDRSPRQSAKESESYSLRRRIADRHRQRKS
jgi:hypothetical protein